jgi:hypothetical protein
MVQVSRVFGQAFLNCDYDKQLVIPKIVNFWRNDGSWRQVLVQVGWNQLDQFHVAIAQLAHAAVDFPWFQPVQVRVGHTVVKLIR